MRLIRDSTVYVIGEIFAKSVPFLLLPYLARKLGVEEYGELANAQAYVAVCLIVLGLSQDGAVVRYFYRYGRRSVGLIISSGAIFSSALFVAILLYGLIVRNLLVFYVACVALAQTFLSVQLALRQCQKKPTDYVFLQLLSGTVTAMLTVLLIESLAPKFEYYLISIALASIAGSLIGYFARTGQSNARVRFGWRVQRTGFIFVLAYGLPMILHQASFFLKGQYDRLLIIDSYGPEALGVYAAGFQIASVFSILVMAVNKATVPYYYEALKNNTIEFRDILAWVFAALFFFWIPAALAYSVPESFFALLLGQSFSSSKDYAVVFLLGLGVNVAYLLLVNFLFYHGDNGFIAFASLCSATLHVFLLFLFISSLTLVWVPLALLFSNFLLVLMLGGRCKVVSSRRNLVESASSSQFRDRS